MAKCRVYSMPDGSVAVTRLNPRHQLPDETEDAFFRREQAKNLTKDAVTFIDVEEAELPPRTHRRKWEVFNGVIRVKP